MALSSARPPPHRARASRGALAAAAAAAAATAATAAAAASAGAARGAAADAADALRSSGALCSLDNGASACRTFVQGGFSQRRRGSAAPARGALGRGGAARAPAAGRPAARSPAESVSAERPPGRRDGVLSLLWASGCVAPGWLPGPAAAAEAPPEAPPKELLESIAQAFAAVEDNPDRPGVGRELEAAEATLGRAIRDFEGRPGAGRWGVPGGREEISMLYSERARARVMQNDLANGKRPEKAAEAVKDYDVVVRIMEDDLYNVNPGKKMYSEYPDALVRRGLAKEELKDWEGAVSDYTLAITLWRPPPGTPDKALRGNVSPQEGDGLGVNPLVLNFRGNALSQLGKFREALVDYKEAVAIFLADGEGREASLSQANVALALYGDGRTDEALSTMQAVTRRDPGVTDMHVALAAVYWSLGQVGKAENEWQFACEKINTGCQPYKDLTWVTEIRRWPLNLADALQAFLLKKAVV